MFGCSPRHCRRQMDVGCSTGMDGCCVPSDVLAPRPRDQCGPIWSLAITSDQARRLLRAWDVSFHEGSPDDVINGKVAGRSSCRSPADQSMVSSWTCDLTALAFMRRTEVEPQAEANRHYYCLLYTSDAADERSSVDLGGR